MRKMAQKAVDVCPERIDSYSPDKPIFKAFSRETDPEKVMLGWLLETPFVKKCAQPCLSILTEAITLFGCGQANCSVFKTACFFFFDETEFNQTFAVGTRCSSCSSKRPACLYGLCVRVATQHSGKTLGVSKFHALLHKGGFKAMQIALLYSFT